MSHSLVPRACGLGGRAHVAELPEVHHGHQQCTVDVLCCPVPCCAVLCCAVLCCVVSRLVAPCHVVSCCVMLCRAGWLVRCSAVQYRAVPCCAVLCCAMPCCAVLCFVVLLHFSESTLSAVTSRGPDNGQCEPPSLTFVFLLFCRDSHPKGWQHSMVAPWVEGTIIH